MIFLLAQHADVKCRSIRAVKGSLGHPSREIKKVAETPLVLLPRLGGQLLARSLLCSRTRTPQVSYAFGGSDLSTLPMHIHHSN